MKLILIIFFTSTIVFTKLSFSQTIAVVNIEKLIDNNSNYIHTINNIEISQKKFLDTFKIKENELQSILIYIEESKLILSETELNNQIENYNNQLNDFKILLDEFNYHYQNEIILIREKVLEEIFVILEKYAIDNQVDLILNSTSYLIALNSIDITKNIEEELNKKNFILEYKDFEQN